MFKLMDQTLYQYLDLGIRGFIKLKVRIQFFIDANKYRQTSCGVQFFSCKSLKIIKNII